MSLISAGSISLDSTFNLSCLETPYFNIDYLFDLAYLPNTFFVVAVVMR
jgi:hypothetical protein